MDATRALRRAGVAARALARSLREPAPPAPAPLDLAACERALRAAGAEAALVRVDARRAPWIPTGLQVEQGAPLTWLAHGDSFLLDRRGPHLDAAFQLRARTGWRAPALRGTGPTHTAPAPHDGPVELCSLWPAELHGPQERVVYDGIPRAAMRGGFDVAVGVWPPGTDVAERLASAAASDPSGLCAREAARLSRPIDPPAGWHAHEHIPFAGGHRVRGDAIEARSHGRAEIVCREARMPLTPTLELRWRWRFDALPGTIDDDTLFTHDHLSVAVEFDDGTDLTYYWSTGMPAETAYRCPLPHWRHREWHLVVRSGLDGLGEWQAERRSVAPDRNRAIGGPAPREVLRVWLIATTVAQRRESGGSYADVELVDGETVLRAV